MTDGGWTALEARNVERVRDWARAWELPGGSAEKMVDEIYADSPEVVAVLQATTVAASGSFKDAWKAAEQKIEKHYRSRRIVFDAFYPSGNTVGVEARVEMLTHSGEKRGWPFAVFLTFDESGRIIRDHTFMPDSPHGDLFEEAARKVKAAGA